MDLYAYLWIVSGIFIAIGGVIAFLAHRQRMEDEAPERHDIAAE